MTVVDGLLKHEFPNPQADDAGPHDHTLASDWNNGHIFAGGSADGDILTWQGANASKGKFRTLVGGTGLTVTVSATQLTVAFTGGVVSPAAGGTGLDTSASSGVPSINAGTWIVNNVLTTNRVLVAAAANTITSFAALTFDGTKFQVTGTGPHSFGTAAVNNQQMTLGGAFSPSSAGAALAISSTLSPPAGASCFGIDVFPTINKAGSGTHTSFASVIVEPPTIGAGASTLTNSSSLMVSGAPSVGDRLRSLWVQAGLSELTGILSVSGGSGTVHSGMVGIELRGGASPSLTAFNRGTSTYLAMIYDCLGHQFQTSGTNYVQIGFVSNSALFNFVANSWTGSGQTEMMRAQTTLQGIVNANTFGLIFVPQFVEAASGTHGQLTGIYVLPTFANGGASTTSVFGINIDGISTAAITPTNVAALRIASPTGATNNYVILNDTGGGLVRFDTVGPYAFGTGGVNLSIQMMLQGSFTSNAADVKGLQINNTLNAGADNGSLIGLFLSPTLVERGAGTHPIEAGMYVSPTITAGAASATNVAGIYIEAITAQTGSTNAAGLNVKPATGATNNFAILVQSGNNLFSGSATTTFGDGVTGNYTIAMNTPLASSPILQFQGAGVTRFTIFRPGTTSDLEIDSSGVANVMYLNNSGNVNFGGQAIGAGIMTYTRGGGLQIGNATGGDKGSGTINVLTAYYGNGTVGVSAGSFSTITAITSTIGIVTQLTGSSDVRMKDVEEPFTRGLAALRSVRPVMFRWKESTGFDRRLQAGFTVQNLMETIPEASWGEGPDGMLIYHERALIATLVNAVKELEAEVERLKAR